MLVNRVTAEFVKSLPVLFFFILFGYLLYYFQPVSFTGYHFNMAEGEEDCFATIDIITNGSDISSSKNNYTPNVIHISVVACGNMFDQSMLLLKSSTLLTRISLHAHIFADDDLRTKFQEQLDHWPDFVRRKFTYTLYPIQYPPDQNPEEWKSMFRACSSQRLFFPDILKDVDFLIYFDADVLILRPLDDVVNLVRNFDSSQIAGVALESETVDGNWYNVTAASHPYVPPFGVNSGVMLMNLTRMRQINWLCSMLLFYKLYRSEIKLGDQDLINIFFYYYPDKLFLFPCNWNYRQDHCSYKSNCKSAEEGISVLHGSRSVFFNDKEPAFKAVYNAYMEHKFGDSLEDDLLPRLQRNLRDSGNGSCSNISHFFTRHLENHVVHQSQTLSIGRLQNKELQLDGKLS